MAWFLKRGVKKGLQKVGGSMGLQEIAITQHQIVTELRKLRDICSRIQYQMPVPPDSLPSPPRELHALVSGDDELDMSAFFEVGRFCAGSVVGLLKKQGLDIDDLGAHRLSAVAECDQLVDLRNEPRPSRGGHKVNVTVFRC